MAQRYPRNRRPPRARTELQRRGARKTPNTALREGVYDTVLDGAYVDPDDYLYRSLSRGSRGDNLPAYKHEKMVSVSKYLARTNMVAKRALGVLVEFVLGEGVSITVRNEQVRAVVNRFWKDPYNDWDRYAPQLLRSLLITGELLMPLFPNEVDGSLRVGVVKSSNIVRVITDDEDWRITRSVITDLPNTGSRATSLPANVIPLGMTPDDHRVYDIVNLTERDELETATRPALFWSHGNDFGDRGISILYAIADFLDLLDQMAFSEVERWLLMKVFVWDVTVDGTDPAQIAELAKDPEYSTPPPTGSVKLHNKSVVWEPKSPALQTGDATSGMTWLRNHTWGSLGLPEHWYAEGGSSNRATAQTMAEPTRKMLTVVQDLWRAIIKDAVQKAIDYAVAHNTIPEEVTVEDAEGNPSEEKSLARDLVVVEMPDLAPADSQQVANAMAAITKTLVMAEQQGYVTNDTARRTFLNILTQLGTEIDIEAEAKRAEQEKTNREQQAAEQMRAQAGQPQPPPAPRGAAQKQPAGSGAPGPTTPPVQEAERGLPFGEWSPDLEEYNKYHDARGRFSSGGGGHPLIDYSAGYDKPKIDHAWRSLDAESGAMGNASNTWHDGLTKDEKEAIASYTNGRYASINSNLRAGKRTITSDMSMDEANAFAVKLDGALAKGELPENVVLHRGGAIHLENLKPGSVFVDRGFISTSTSLDVAHSNIKTPEKGYQKVIFHIKAPKGSSAGIVGKHSRVSSESEVILPRGSGFRVSSSWPSREFLNTLNVIVDLLPPGTVEAATSTGKPTGGKLDKNWRSRAYRASRLTWLPGDVVIVEKSAASESRLEEFNKHHDPHSGEFSTAGGSTVSLGDMSSINIHAVHAITTGKNKQELHDALVAAGVESAALKKMSSSEQYDALKALKKTSPAELKAHVANGTQLPKHPGAVKKTAPPLAKVDHATLAKVHPAMPEPSVSGTATSFKRVNTKSTTMVKAALHEGSPSAGQAKNQVAKALSKRLEGNPAFSSLLNDPAFKSHFGSTPMEKTVNSLVHQWAVTSADSHERSIALQMATRDEFGLHSGLYDPGFGKHGSEAMYAKHGAAMRAFVRAQHDETQAYFKSRGITEMTLVRGMSGVGNKYPHGQEATVHLQPASSFSVVHGSSGAGKFGNTKFVVTVPTSHVLGSCRTGWGCLDENEVIVLGGEIHSVVSTSGDPWSAAKSVWGT